ncbi:hypothetical protein M8C21_011257 [Ambrosia artemisiifolia]|uniref:F-box domain-containing protein n=1 Tax=Ambrosia artemisiifolia TaxID=4212 RepID=A0AAD5D354_AMBAR|nr:hypothetical protein M8C21_011257 [Ambrosia artemisiifolia]
MGGTTKTGNTSINQIDDASTSKSIKTTDNSGLPSWSNVYQDLLFTVMMKLELADFFSFSRVCKAWRSLAFAHINKYMGSRQPMSWNMRSLSVTGRVSAINPDTWDNRRIQYERSGSLKKLDISETKGRLLIADMWYLNFPHDCVNFNTLPPQ